MKTLFDLLVACAWVALSCVVYMYLLSQTSFCLIVADSVVMFNSTTTERWPFPRYFGYNIVRGPGNTGVEWIRVYISGQWQPVAESTLGPAPDDSSTYREWRRFYHFEVYWPRDSTGGTIASLAQPVSYASFYTWQYRDWYTRGYQRLGNPHPSIARPVFLRS